jgi:PIN domain nuclease of toxin-antitoxin system
VRTRLLIDSELALWALAAPARLPRAVRDLLDASEVYVSAASILEIGLKAAQGPLAAEVLAALEPSGFRTLAVSAEHAALAAGLAAPWPDWLDRLLVAQAGAEGMTLLTTDAALAAVPTAACGPVGRTRAQKAQEAAAQRRRVRGAGASRRHLTALPPQPCRIVLVAGTRSRRRVRG